jgi:hypothetical protein
MRTRQRTRRALRPCCTLPDSICRPPAHAGCRGDDLALRIPPLLQQRRSNGCRCSSTRKSLPRPVDRRMCTAEVHSSGRLRASRNWHTLVTGEERACLGHEARYAVGIQQPARQRVKKTRPRCPGSAARRTRPWCAAFRHVVAGEAPGVAGTARRAGPTTAGDCRR